MTGSALHAAHFGRRQDGYDQSDLPDAIILLKVIVSLFCIKKLLLTTLLRTIVTAKCACIKNTNVCFFRMYACKSSWSTF